MAINHKIGVYFVLSGIFKIIVYVTTAMKGYKNNVTSGNDFLLCVFTLVEVAAALQATCLVEGLKTESYHETKNWIQFELVSLISQIYAWSVLRESVLHIALTNEYIAYASTLILVFVALRYVVEATMFFLVIWMIQNFRPAEDRQEPVDEVQEEEEEKTVDMLRDKPPTYDESLGHPKSDIEPPKYEDVGDLV